MKLIRASIHELTTRDELKVEYARLTYRTRTGIVGQSRLRALTLIDNYTRECLAIDIGQNLRGAM